jgi:transposase
MSEKFTSRRKNAILRKMREGHYAKTAAETSGISEQMLYNWLKKGECPERYPEHAAFLEAYRKAEATAEEKAIKAIQAAFPDDWRAARPIWSAGTRAAGRSGRTWTLRARGSRSAR